MSSLMLQAAAAAAGGQQYPAGTLYLVPTPIGNLADLTLRAVHVLSLVDAVACEDTRVTGALLRHLGLDKPLMAVHEHNEAAAASAVVERLARGERIAYASDAGTPAVSDPGARLVQAVALAGHRVMPLPGPSAAVTALSASGDTTGHGFLFAGFLPTRSSERRTALEALVQQPASVVLFEAPHRIEALLGSLATQAAGRLITVCRELTKQFEEIATIPAGDAPAWLAADANRSRGEFAVVVHGAAARSADEGRGDEPSLRPESEKALAALVAELPLKQAVALAAQITGEARNALYQRALAMKQAPEES